MSSPCTMCWIHGIKYDEVKCHDCEMDVVFRCLKAMCLYDNCHLYCKNHGNCENCEEHNNFHINYESICDLSLLNSEIK